MTISLDHTIVPSHDKDASARFIATILAVPYDGAGHFAPVRINETLTLDFADGTDFDEHHYAFVVSEDDFDDMFGRIKTSAASHGSGPFSSDDGQINHRRGGRGVYFRGGPDRHLWELMTTPETGA
jgi:hypothetical protein